MLPHKEVVYVKEIPSNANTLLVSDIGGTNSNFGVFDIQGRSATLLISLHYKSADVTDFADLITQLLEYLRQNYQIKIKRACLAAAGVISHDRTFVKPTNLAVSVDTKAIQQKTGLECVFLANDFEVIGYGIARINPKDVVTVYAGVAREHAHQAILGAGTGLGKCLMYWNDAVGRYVPLASEGGHADFPIQTQQEFDLCRYIQNYEGWQCNVSWEDVLSGNGIQRIHHFLSHSNRGGKQKKGMANHGPHPDEIFKSRMFDVHCANTFKLYTQFYARCAKNYVLDALALGGIYIAGGIAAKNLEMFELPEFTQEFFNCGKQAELLKNVPIYVITDYNVSLYGAAEYMILEGLCK